MGRSVGSVLVATWSPTRRYQVIDSAMQSRNDRLTVSRPQTYSISRRTDFRRESRPCPFPLHTRSNKFLFDLQLDSTAAKEVVSCVAALARKEGIMVLTSIHQPSYSTLNEFTDLILLSRGSVCYHGPVSKLDAFLSELGAESLPFVSPGALVWIDSGAPRVAESRLKLVHRSRRRISPCSS